jgi:hypothetical protein
MSRKTHEEERYVYTNTVAVASLLDWSIGEAEEGDERGRWSFIDFFVSCRHLLFCRTAMQGGMLGGRKSSTAGSRT